MAYGPVVVFLGVVLLGCSEASAPPATTTSIRLEGTIRNAATQAPIQSAQVILQWSAGAFGTGTRWAETDAEGNYTLDLDAGGSRFKCDGFGMTAQATGFRPSFVQPGSVRCVPEAQRFDFSLEPEA